MAVIVKSPQLDAPCTEMWADPVEVAAVLGVTASEAEEAVIEATYALWALSGFKYHGFQCWQEDFLLAEGQRTLMLPKWPVHEVISISTLDTPSVSGNESAVDDWTWDGKYVYLSAPPSGPLETLLGVCGPKNLRIRVRYRIAPFLAPGAERAVVRLATEFYKARQGQACSLPDRITAVTRQGVSWTILDPQDFLTLGRVGIGPIDAWIALTNRYGFTRAIDTLYAPIVLHSVQTGCGADCDDT